MHTFNFSAPTHVTFGPGAATLAVRRLTELGARRAVIVTDRGVRAAGLLLCVEQDGARAAAISVFDQIEPNPRDETVHRLADFIREQGAEAMVAVGGGSPIDAAKAAGVVAANGGHITDYAGRDRVPLPIMPVIAIPTTAGTGSEVSFSAVITDSRRQIKFSVSSRRLAAASALVDPDLTLTLPPHLTAATGMDALTHAIEALTATCTNPISQTLAKEAISLVGRHLRRAVSHGSDRQARTGMLLASTLAGMAFASADVGAVHCMAEALGGVYDTGHGVANSACLPLVMRYNLPAAAGEYAQVAAALGERTSGMTLEQAAELAVSVVTRLGEELGIPRVTDLGIRPTDLDRLASLAADNGSTPSNAREIAHDNYLDLFGQMLG